MNETELIQYLSNQCKPYVGYVKQSRYSNVITRYKAGLCKPKTIRQLFFDLGYCFHGGVWIKP